MSGFRGVERLPLETEHHAAARESASGVLSEGRLPLEVRSRETPDLAEWAGAHPDEIQRWLDIHGAVLFRDFGVRGLDSVADVVLALAGPPLPYLERSTPRTELAAGVYTSTDYPADQDIPLHNENSYQSTSPARLVFCCLRPAESGGATVLADCRAVLRRIDVHIVQAFRERGVGYLRNYSPGLGSPWQEAFQTAERADVESYCREHDITVQWRGETLRTWQRRPALKTHQRTGEEVWFNHAAIFHPSSLPAEVADPLLAQCGPDGLPVQSRYGDGEPIEDDVMAVIQAAYAAETVPVRWQAGEVLLIDNQLVAHGRTAFTGSRQVVVSMAGQV